MKVMTVFGTRPEAIKMCPLILQLKRTEGIECCVCLTGQHKEMLQQVIDVFKIQVDYNLSIMRGNQTLSSITRNILEKIEEVFYEENPDLVLVHGDTSTSFAVALAAFYNHIPIGHVEAGLRTNNMNSPYPEEFNRQSVDLISELYFAPTELAKKNLLREGKKLSQIIVTGNTVIDALYTTIQSEYKNDYLDWAKGSKFIIFTAHRRENIGKPMENMFRALVRIVNEFPDVKVIYPIHKNPRVRKIANQILTNEERIKLIEPLDVVDFHNFMAQSYLVLTDSGGVQEEAPALGKPVLVMRDTTERPEGLEAGTLKLVGTKEEDIYLSTKMLLTNEHEYNKMSQAVNPYGDGHASEKIVKAIQMYFREGEK